jgi:hypothetical protein
MRDTRLGGSRAYEAGALPLLAGPPGPATVAYSDVKEQVIDDAGIISEKGGKSS